MKQPVKPGAWGTTVDYLDLLRRIAEIGPILEGSGGFELPFELTQRRRRRRSANDQMQDGPVLLVGHSWGGAIITEAGNEPQVRRGHMPPLRTTSG
jgi:pimeloyl-ACP methyl ester carboxylesterase